MTYVYTASKMYRVENELDALYLIDELKRNNIKYKKLG